MNTPPRKRYPVAVDAHAHRLGNSSGKKVSKLPIPIAIELHNLLPRTQRVPTKKWFRPEYATSLLHVVRLEISIDSGSKTNEHESSTVPPRNRPLHSFVHSRLTQCPVWQHLDDSINFRDLTVDEYESLTARFYADKGTTESPHDSTHVSEPTQFFLETALHPSKLCRIARLPCNLPLNCTVVRFSDNSLRVHPADYQLLLSEPSDHGVAVAAAPVVKASTLASSPHGTKSGPLNISASQDDAVFDDQVFTALDAPSPVTTPIRDVVSEAMHIFKDLSVTNLLDQEDSSLELNGDGAADNGAKNGPVGDHVPTFDIECDDIDAPNGYTIQPDISQEIDEYTRQQLELDLDVLERLVQRESQALERETAALHQEKKLLLDLTETIQETYTRIEQIECAVRVEQPKLDESLFLVEAERIRLIRELSVVYPISVDGSRRYFIRGLELPLVLFVGSPVPDDVVSAALGFLCHTVHLMSKYLGVHLRYRLHYQSSQSVIQNEYDATFPLFLSRPVERDKFEHAVHLLDACIDCICRAQGIQVSHKLHILAKTMRIYEKVIEGY